MAILNLEVKFIKIQHSQLLQCKDPQYNSVCQGLYIKTRRYQKECVSCMKLHDIIHKHPLLSRISKPIIYGKE